MYTAIREYGVRSKTVNKIKGGKKMYRLNGSKTTNTGPIFVASACPLAEEMVLATVVSHRLCVCPALW